MIGKEQLNVAADLKSQIISKFEIQRTSAFSDWFDSRSLPVQAEGLPDSSDMGVGG